jgi:hypothetical protein
LNGILYHRTVASLLTVRLSAGDKPKQWRSAIARQLVLGLKSEAETEPAVYSVATAINSDGVHP